MTSLRVGKGFVRPFIPGVAVHLGGWRPLGSRSKGACRLMGLLSRSPDPVAPWSTVGSPGGLNPATPQNRLAPHPSRRSKQRR